MTAHELAQPLRVLAAAVAQIEDHPVLAGLSSPANLIVAAAHELDSLVLDLDVARGRRWKFTVPPDESG